MMQRVLTAVLVSLVSVACTGGDGDDGAGPDAAGDVTGGSGAETTATPDEGTSDVSAATTDGVTTAATSEAEVPATTTTTADPTATAVDDADQAASGSSAPDSADDATTSSTTARVTRIDGPATVDDLEDADDQGPVSSAAPAPADGDDCAAVPRGVSELSIEGGGATHDVRIFVPDELAATPAPVVLDWHGLGSAGPEQAAYSGYETLAATEGFIAVHPTGVPAGGGNQNAWELTQFDTDERDDLAFADVLIDTVVAEWCGDGARIYSTGMSNGGFFTSELVCNRADRIAAAVSVAGVTHPDSCSPGRAVPYAAFHGTDDAVVPFDGDGESVLAQPGGDNSFFQQVMPDEFAEFAADFGCDAEPTRTEETPEVVRYDYTGCDAGVPLTFYELPGSGHTWPDSPIADSLGGSLGVHTTDISATEDGWAFLSRHSLDT